MQCSVVPLKLALEFTDSLRTSTGFLRMGNLTEEETITNELLLRFASQKGDIVEGVVKRRVFRGREKDAGSGLSAYRFALSATESFREKVFPLLENNRARTSRQFLRGVASLMHSDIEECGGLSITDDHIDDDPFGSLHCLIQTDNEMDRRPTEDQAEILANLATKRLSQGFGLRAEGDR